MNEENDRGRVPRRYRDVALAVLAVVALYAVFYIAGIGCPIKFLTGVSCFGCGMTRAVLAVLRLDFAAAFHYHPLWMVPTIWIGAYLLRQRFPKVYKAVTIIAIILFVAVYIVRMINGADDIVVFEPENGLFFKGLKYIVYQM